MDPVNPVGLSRSYDDVSRVEKTRRVRRGRKKQDEYKPSKGAHDDPPGEGEDVDTFDPSDRAETP